MSVRPGCASGSLQHGLVEAACIRVYVRVRGSQCHVSGALDKQLIEARSDATVRNKAF